MIKMKFEPISLQLPEKCLDSVNSNSQQQQQQYFRSRNQSDTTHSDQNAGQNLCWRLDCEEGTDSQIYSDLGKAWLCEAVDLADWSPSSAGKNCHAHLVLLQARRRSLRKEKGMLQAFKRKHPSGRSGGGRVGMAVSGDVFPALVPVSVFFWKQHAVLPAGGALYKSYSLLLTVRSLRGQNTANHNRVKELVF